MLFQPYTLGDLTLRNRVVMAPMTRNRANSDNVPTPIMAGYYAQRAGVGLIVTEGTSPSPDGLGYPRIPGLFNAAQVEGWRAVTDAVHAAGGRIFVQLMHTGRVSAAANLPEGARVVGPYPEPFGVYVYTDDAGMPALRRPPHPHGPGRIGGVGGGNTRPVPGLAMEAGLRIGVEATRRATATSSSQFLNSQT